MQMSEFVYSRDECFGFYKFSFSFRAPTVSVTVGNVLTYEIGVLSYASPNLMHGLSRHAWIGVIAGNCFLFKKFIVLSFCLQRSVLIFQEFAFYYSSSLL